MNWLTNIFKKLFSTKRGAQKYIDNKYPFSKRKEITELLIQNHRLAGPLSLKGFVNLRVLNCSYNRITSLNLSDCQNVRRLYCNNNQRIKKLDLSNLPNLELLYCHDNHFSDLNFLNTIPNPKNLRELMIYNNQFPPTDLTFISRFVNLWLLSIGSHYSTEKEQEEKRKYNRFCGSLKPLQRLTKLYNLTIINTDVDGDLKYLPKSITIHFYYEGSSKIENKLKKHDFNLQKWRENA